MSASQAEGRGFKSRFPLQKIEGVASYDVTPFLMRPAAVPPMGLFRALISRPAKPQTGNTSMSQASAIPYSADVAGEKRKSLSGSWRHPYAEMPTPKRPHHHRLHWKTDSLRFPHGILPHPVPHGVPLFPPSKHVLELTVIALPKQ